MISGRESVHLVVCFAKSYEPISAAVYVFVCLTRSCVWVNEFFSPLCCRITGETGGRSLIIRQVEAGLSLQVHVSQGREATKNTFRICLCFADSLTAWQH